MLSNTGKIVKNTDQSKIKLDQQIKRVLACKPILSRILKEVVEECKPYSPEEVENFIEGDVQISQEFVNPGHPEVIHGQSEEDYVNGEAWYGMTSVHTL